MSQFDGIPSGHEEDDFSLTPKERELMRRIDAGEFGEEVKDLKDNVSSSYEEVVESETKEWAERIEQASTAEQRLLIIFNIISIADIERRLQAISDPDTKSELKKLINEIRVGQNLPPKYPI